MTELMLAVKNGEVNRVKALSLFDATRRDDNGMTALMYAAKSYQLECVKILINTEGKMVDDKGFTALMHAVMGNGGDKARLDIISFLIPFEAKRLSKEGLTSLMYAVIKGDIEVIELLAPHEYGIKDKVCGYTAMIHAVFNNRLDVVQLLMNYEVRCTDNRGHSALMYAVRTNQIKMVHLLADKESRLRDNKGVYTALIYAVETGCDEAVKILSVHECREVVRDGRSALMHATLCNRVDYVRLLCDAECGLRDAYGRSALMHAAIKGYANIVEILFDKEACLQDHCGYSALIHACENNHVECVKLLMDLERGLTTTHGLTALMMAIVRGSEEAADVMKDKESNIITSIKETALMIAAEMHQNNVVKFLAEREFNQRDKDGRTALMKAVMHNNINGTKLLIPLEQGLQDYTGKTALMHAVINENYRCSMLLARYELKRQDHRGQSALMIAAEGDSDIHCHLISSLIDEAGLRDNYGNTALMFAVMRHNVYAVECLKDKEANCINHEGKSALSLALSPDRVDIFRILFPLEYNTVDPSLWFSYIVNNGLIDLLNPTMLTNVSINRSELFLSPTKVIKPFIPVGSFLDILNRTVSPVPTEIELMIPFLSHLTTKRLREYLNITPDYSEEFCKGVTTIIEMLRVDFPALTDQLNAVHTDMLNDEYSCCVCYEFDNDRKLYRNCVKCKCIACSQCWERVQNCPVCKSFPIWTKFIRPLDDDFLQLLEILDGKE